ncbi:hypothetical protein D3C75_828380 [compost metagenome]
MFPKPQEVAQNMFPVRSASRDPHAEGKRLAKAMFRGVVFFGAIVVGAFIDIKAPGYGSPVFYGVVAMFSLIPLSVTLF